MQLSVYLDDDVIEEIRRIASKNKRSVSWIINNIVRKAVLEKR